MAFSPRYLDIINVMCYDYHGGWEKRTGHNAPLYARPDEEEDERLLNVVSAAISLPASSRFNANCFQELFDQLLDR